MEAFQDNLFAYFPPLYRMLERSPGTDTPDEPLLASDISVFIACYCYLFQPLAHVVIAMNRFKASRSPTGYRWMWRDASFKRAVSVIFAVPLLAISSVLPLHYADWSLVCVESVALWF